MPQILLRAQFSCSTHYRTIAHFVVGLDWFVDRLNWLKYVEVERGRFWFAVAATKVVLQGGVISSKTIPMVGVPLL